MKPSIPFDVWDGLHVLREGENDSVAQGAHHLLRILEREEVTVTMPKKPVKKPAAPKKAAPKKGKKKAVKY